MSDLISRSALIEEIVRYLFSNKFNLDTFGRDLREIIDSQPTAYDVEKVVEELEEIKQDWKMKEQERGLNFMDCVILREYQKHYDKAIDIVRKGGTE